MVDKFQSLTNCGLEHQDLGLGLEHLLGAVHNLEMQNSNSDVTVSSRDSNEDSMNIQDK